LEDPQELSLDNDHNVYVLGAGFSAPAGPSVIANFMNTMRDGVLWLGEHGRRDEAKAIEQVLGFRSRVARAAERVPLNLEDIEQIFSLASASGDPTLVQSATLAIAATLDYAESATPMPSERVAVEEVASAGLVLPDNWQPQRARKRWYDKLPTVYRTSLRFLSVRLVRGKPSNACT